MWARFRKWKHGVIPMLGGVAYLLLRRTAEGSAAWYAAFGLCGMLGLTYIVEELVWNYEGGGRPCAACGHRVQLKSFRVRNTCPGCGHQL